MPDLLYLIGQPGSGKSTLAEFLTADLEGLAASDPFSHIVYPAAKVVALGAIRETFSGTDALPMNVQPKVVNWLRETSHQLVLGEGDRLANGKFFQAALDAGWDVRLAYLALPGSVAEDRRLARQLALRTSPQDPTWVKGRITKARRLAEEWGSRLYRLNANQPTPEIAQELRRAALGNSVVFALDAARARG